MKLLEKILVPIDINAEYNEQLNVASKIAKLYHSELIIMYVLSEKVLQDDTMKMVNSSISISLNQVKEILRKEKIVLREPIIENGSPADKINQIAIKEDVNLILIGSGNKKKGEKFQLGITAEKIIRLSDKPVWSVKTGEEAKISNILCPVDFSGPSKRALNNAILLSRKLKTSLRILGIQEPFSNSSPRIKIDEDKENEYNLQQFKNGMTSFLKDFNLDGIEYIIDIQLGIVHEKILQTIKEFGHDLLIMGTNGRTGLSRLIMGGITEKVTREMPCSFITLKTYDIIQLRIENEIKEIEIHFKHGNALTEDGFFEEAIKQFKICLQINDMHIPSYYKLAEVFKKIGDNSRAEHYNKTAEELLARLWDKKIEHEIRKHYRQNN